jgi:hypothetical protein
MNRPTLAERAMPEIPVPRDNLPPPTTNRRDPNLSPALQELADTLRDQGHSVHTASVHPPLVDDHQLASWAAHFFGQALSLSEATQSVRAHIRVYHSNGLLFLEATQLKPRSFESAARQRSGHDALNGLKEWAEGHGHLLSIRRGPRDQLRIALMIKSVTNDSDEHGNKINGSAAGFRSRGPKFQHVCAVAADTARRSPQNPKEA